MPEMSETIKTVKFKTNVSFVGSDGVLYFGGSVVQLFPEDFESQVEVCEQFGLPAPELIEEIEAVVQPDQEPEGEKPKGRGRKPAQPEGEKPEGEKPEGEKPEGDESEL
jgi:hypothetical protein